MNRDNNSDNKKDDPVAIVHSRKMPTLLMQAEPRLVVTANKSARTLFNKSLSEIEGHRGGEVFDCIHAFSEAGCGLDKNCEDCRIKDAVLDTFASGKPHENVETVLNIKKQEETVPYAMIITTESVGNFVLITVVKYDEIP